MTTDYSFHGADHHQVLHPCVHVEEAEEEESWSCSRKWQTQKGTHCLTICMKCPVEANAETGNGLTVARGWGESTEE